MLIQNRILRATSSIAIAIAAALAAFWLLIRLPMWLLGLARPWELRSNNDLFTADAFSLVAVLLILVTLPAVARVVYKALSPSAARAEGEIASQPNAWMPNTSLERTREG